MNLKKFAIVLNGFIHDFATGYWLSALIAVGFLDRFQTDYPAVAELLGRIERFFFWNSVGAVIVILATGAGRTFTYVDNVFGEQTEQARRRMLIIKHIVLFIVFGIGGWWAFRKTFP
jgi:uncharacterized membrane protein